MNDEANMSRRESGEAANVRWDVRVGLRRLGWRPHGHMALTRGRVTWAPSNESGDSSVSRYDGKRAEFTIGFPGDVPVEVIVAACESAAKGARRT